MQCSPLKRPGIRTGLWRRNFNPGRHIPGRFEQCTIYFRSSYSMKGVIPLNNTEIPVLEMKGSPEGMPTLGVSELLSLTHGRAISPNGAIRAGILCY